jgi:hypothetical protein
MSKDHQVPNSFNTYLTAFNKQEATEQEAPVVSPRLKPAPSKPHPPRSRPDQSQGLHGAVDAHQKRRMLQDRQEELLRQITEATVRLNRLTNDLEDVKLDLSSL